MTAATPTPEFLGLVVLALVFLSRWLWDYNRSRREDAAQHEPKATPPLHVQFVTRAEFDAHVADIGTRLEKIEQAGEQRAIRIYDKIDAQSDRILEFIRREART